MKNIMTKKQLLSGNWLIDTDCDDTGKEKNYQFSHSEDAVLTHVPSIIQETFPEYNGTAWYWSKFELSFTFVADDRVFLKFGAVDYKAEVWLNGRYLGDYEGGETEFEFDATEAIKNAGEGENLLAVRVINTCNRTIDGLNITNTPNRNKNVELRSGYTIDFGGMLGNVWLELREAVSITDVFAEGNIHTGELKIQLEVTNYTPCVVDCDVKLGVYEKSGNGSLVSGTEKSISALPGKSSLEYTLTVDDPLLWELDDPNLYGIRCELESDYGVSENQHKFGFREFLIKEGFFFLNGKRIFLKCSHSGNAQPIGIGYPAVKDFTRRDFINAKAAGFNMIRVCAFLFRPEQLDFCDELGLMIMDECYAAWMVACESHPENALPLGKAEDYLARFDNSTSNMIRQDRNHASVVIYEMLNETGNSDVFRRAVEFLPKARKLDKFRLLLLNSGRFDGDFSIGCASNPYSDRWEKVWGADAVTKIPGIHEIGPSVIGAGDVHLYPFVPHTEDTYNHFFALGNGMRPVFLSEYGIGTQFNVIHEAGMFEQNGADKNLLDYKWVKKQADDLKRDFTKFGFDRVYPFAGAMLEESQRLGARQRTLGFNLIRSNPHICGFSMTGLLDHGMCGEGLWTYWRRFKPEMYDAVYDGFNALRFCLVTYPTNAYANRPFRVKASLATEDALRPGVYRSSYRIVGGSGVVWEKNADIVIPDSMPFAVPVFDEMITLDVPTGKYTLYADMEGGSPTGGKLVFYITNEKDIAAAPEKVMTWGVSDGVKSFLSEHGVTVSDFDGKTDAPVIVGNPSDYDNGEKWDQLLLAAENGQTVLYMQSQLFLSHGELAEKTGISGGFNCFYNQDHLYHKEVVPMPHPVFDGIMPGMFDLDYVGTVFPHEIVEADENAVNEIICSSFLTGSIWIKGAYGSYYSIFGSNVGKGRVIISTPYILENIGNNPAADRIMMNFIRYICKKRKMIINTY